MGYYLFIMLLSMFLNNCDSITPIHIWLIEFFIFAIIAVIVLYIQENKDEDDKKGKLSAVISDIQIKDFLNVLLNGSKNKQGNDQIDDLFGRDAFSYAKPEELIKAIIEVTTSEGDLVLDFFSGSATTAQAVMQLNSEDNGKTWNQSNINTGDFYCLTVINDTVIAGSNSREGLIYSEDNLDMIFKALTETKEIKATDFTDVGQYVVDAVVKNLDEEKINNIYGIIYTNPRSKEVALAKNYIIRRNYHDVSRNRYSPYC